MAGERERGEKKGDQGNWGKEGGGRRRWLASTDAVMLDQRGENGGRNEDEVVIRKLVQAHRVISRGTAQKAYHGLWMKAFMGKEKGIEHEAFLACWLSRFVFPIFPFGVVNKRMFRMTVCLAKGDQVALGPIVLASVYRDLGLLKSTMDAAAVMEEWREDEKGVTIQGESSREVITLLTESE
ncbi:hypothetical protein Drorol1_Dr00014809 [Drosera rotundifolia]